MIDITANPEDKDDKGIAGDYMSKSNGNRNRRESSTTSITFSLPTFNFLISGQRIHSTKYNNDRD